MISSPPASVSPHLVLPFLPLSLRGPILSATDSHGWVRLEGHLRLSFPLSRVGRVMVEEAGKGDPEGSSQPVPTPTPSFSPVKGLGRWIGLRLVDMRVTPQAALEIRLHAGLAFWGAFLGGPSTGAGTTALAVSGGPFKALCELRSEITGNAIPRRAFLDEGMKTPTSVWCPPVALVRFSLCPCHWAAGPLLLPARGLLYTGPIGHQGTAGRF